MKTFKDNADRTWEVAVTVDSLKRVKDMLEGLDLLELGDEKIEPEDQVIFRLSTDPILLVNVVYVVCKPQADEAGVSDEDFGRAMAGDAIDNATKALLEDLVDFFPSRRDRERVKRLLSLTWEMLEKVQDHLDAKYSDERMRAEATAQLALLEKEAGDDLPPADPGSGKSSGSGPESSESTPAP